MIILRVIALPRHHAEQKNYGLSNNYPDQLRNLAFLPHRLYLSLIYHLSGLAEPLIFEDTKRMGFPLVFVTVVVHLNSDL